MDSPLKRVLVALFWGATGFALRAAGTFSGVYLALKLHGGWSGLLFFIALAMGVSAGYPILVGFLHGFFEPASELKLAAEIFAIPLLWIAGIYYLSHSNYLIGSDLHYLFAVLVAAATAILLLERLFRIGHYQPMRISWFG